MDPVLANRPNKFAGNWVLRLSFQDKYQILSQKSWKSRHKVLFWFANLCFFPMKFNNLNEIAHNWVLGFEFLKVFCLSLSFLLEFWAFLSLSFFKNVQFLSLMYSLVLFWYLSFGALSTHPKGHPYISRFFSQIFEDSRQF